MDRLVLYGSFTSSSSYKPMLYLALARLPFSFHTVDLKTGAQRTPELSGGQQLGGRPVAAPSSRQLYKDSDRPVLPANATDHLPERGYFVTRGLSAERDRRSRGGGSAANFNGS
jgi:hypothetical protein